MDIDLKETIKSTLKEAIRNYFKNNKSKRNYQILDLVFPVERRIRSLIGGLETSLGTTFWEPVAKILAQRNGFTVKTDKLMRPDPFPELIQNELNNLINERQTKPSGSTVTTQECMRRLRNAASEINLDDTIRYVFPPKGTGIDLHLLKDGHEYVFDMKTTQPNLADLGKFNKQLLEWYAYKFATDADAHFEARIAIPFNPYQKPWREHQKSKLSKSPLDIESDIWVGDEFWDFCSGKEDTLSGLKNIFTELGKEDFSKEFSDFFYGK